MKINNQTIALSKTAFVFASLLSILPIQAQTNSTSGLAGNIDLRSALDCSGTISKQRADASIPAAAKQIANPLVDYDTFLTHAADIGKLRTERRVTEEKFIEMAAQPGTVVFDARSDDKYQKLHIEGAKHLSFTEITAPELAKVFPDKATRILIYCNNNFLNAPNNFASKVASASLNIHTFNTLYSYGYTNVYELGPLIDIKKSKLTFAGTQLATP
jgi:phage shock protein E